MCLIDTKRFRFTFKRIPVKKVILKADFDDGTVGYKSPCMFTFIYKKCSIQLLMTNLFYTLRDLTMLDFSAAFPHHLKHLFRGIKSNLKEVWPFPKYVDFNDATIGHIKGYLFNFGFFHAFQSNCEQQKIDIFIDELNSIYKLDRNKFIIVTGYIPAFTRYAKGVSGVSQGEICARRMILNI